jgi:prepilin-type N-terminal cleavage/methylation domain-containing protein
MTRLRQQSGWTLIEMLVAMTLMLVVLSATLTTLDSGGQTRSTNERRNDAVEQARVSIDKIVRQLRNLASPSPAIDRATATDFSFRTFDPTKRLVRYCLQTDNLGNLTTTATNLIQMISTTDTPGDYNHCTLSPTVTPNWNSRRVVAQNLVNHRTGTASTNADVFSYNGSSANTATISNVRINLVIDINSLAAAPTASFTVANPSVRRFILNAANSFDPENRNLQYTWYVARTATFIPAAGNQIGFGPALDYTFPSGAPSATDYYFKLVVSDSNLTDTCPTSAGDKTNCPTAGPKSI